jgi:hypothetical protein
LFSFSQTEDPPYLSVGTEISARFKGAYCEAVVKSVQKSVKVKVIYKESPFGTGWLNHDRIDGTLELNATVLAHVNNTDRRAQATVISIKDQSVYVAVFNDGDERTLRRSQICLKGAKHYGDETLDTMPLNNPEQFYSPHVVHSSLSDTRPTSSMRFNELSRREEKVHKLKNASSSTSVTSTTKPTGRPRGRPPSHGARESSHSGSPSLVNKQAPVAEKGIKQIPKTNVAERQLSSSSEDSFTEEERDAFVARWYKFREDSGDPCNKAPTLGKQDVDLYRMYRAVKSMGGWNKVNKANSWARVMHIMHVSAASGATPTLLKNCYKRFMADFEAFVRQFGWSMSGGERRIPMDEQRQRSPSGKTAFGHKTADAAAMKPVVNAGRKNEEINKDKKSKRDDTLEPIGANRSRKRSVSATPSSTDSVGDGKRDGTVGPDASMFVGTVRANEAQTPSGARCIVGQRVRALCKTQWYEARIVLIDCYVNTGNTNVDNKKLTTPPPLPIVARVRVHYHGWKARFDEWVTSDGLRIDGNMDAVDQPTDHPSIEYKSRLMTTNRNRSTSISSTGPSSMRGESTKRVDGASTRHQHKVATVAKKSKLDEKTVKTTENDDTDTTDTSSTTANNHMVVKTEAPKDAVKSTMSRKRQTSFSLEADTSKRGRPSMKESSKSIVKLTKATGDLKQGATSVHVKIGDSDEHTDEESEEEDDDDEDETQVEARVTRSRAAADPIKRFDCLILMQNWINFLNKKF